MDTDVPRVGNRIEVKTTGFGLVLFLVEVLVTVGRALSVVVAGRGVVALAEIIRCAEVVFAAGVKGAIVEVEV